MIDSRVTYKLPPLLIGETVGGAHGIYTFGRAIGLGSTSTVYYAERDDGTEWAIKIFDILPRSDLALCRSMFERECRLRPKLDHPCLPHFEEIVTMADGRPAIVAAYISGTKLADVIAAGPFNPARALDVASQVCDILAYLHRQKPPIAVNPGRKPSSIAWLGLYQNLYLDLNDHVWLIEVGDLRVGNAQACRYDQAEIAGLVVYLLTGMDNAPLSLVNAAPGLLIGERQVLARAVRLGYGSIGALGNALRICLKQRAEQ